MIANGVYAIEWDETKRNKKTNGKAKPVTAIATQAQLIDPNMQSFVYWKCPDAKQEDINRIRAEQQAIELRKEEAVRDRLNSVNKQCESNHSGFTTLNAGSKINFFNNNLVKNNSSLVSNNPCLVKSSSVINNISANDSVTCLANRESGVLIIVP